MLIMAHLPNLVYYVLFHFSIIQVLSHLVFRNLRQNIHYLLNLQRRQIFDIVDKTIFSMSIINTIATKNCTGDQVVALPRFFPTSLR